MFYKRTWIVHAVLNGWFHFQDGFAILAWAWRLLADINRVSWWWCSQRVLSILWEAGDAPGQAHPTTGRKVECQLCNQTFPVGNLRWHSRTLHNKVNWVFSVSKSFRLQRMHWKTTLKQIFPVRDINISCHICHKEYKDLYHHVKYFHEKIRNYECSYCEKKFQAWSSCTTTRRASLGEDQLPRLQEGFLLITSRHVRETYERIKKPVLTVRKRSYPCPTCLATSGRSTTMRAQSAWLWQGSPPSPTSTSTQVCHKKLKKTCDICNEEVPIS